MENKIEKIFDRAQNKKNKSMIIPIIIILVLGISIFWMNQNRKKDQEEILIQKINNAEIPEEFEGIGVMLAEREGIVTIVKTIKGSPAENIGLQIGDRIIEIDDKETKEMDLNQVQDRVRGAIGSKVKLTIARQGDSPEITEEVIVTRDEIVSEGSSE